MPDVKPSLDIRYMVCELGFNASGVVLLRWPDKGIEELRKNMTPVQILQLVTTMETGMGMVISELCGGPQ